MKVTAECCKKGESLHFMRLKYTDTDCCEGAIHYMFTCEKHKVTIQVTLAEEEVE